VRWVLPFLVGSALSVVAAQHGFASDQRGEGMPLWDFYNAA